MDSSKEQLSKEKPSKEEPSKKQLFKEQPSEQQPSKKQPPTKYEKKIRANVNMINLSLDEPKIVAKNKDIKYYKTKSERDLIKIFSLLKPKISIPEKEIKEIKKDFDKLRYRFSKSEASLGKVFMT